MKRRSSFLRFVISIFLIACGIVWAGGFSAPAKAQWPTFFPGQEDDKKPERKEASEEPNKPATPEAPKEYKKPDPPELPEGEVQVLLGPVARIVFKGIVNPGMGEHVSATIQRANQEGAQAILIELDTPGGLVDTTQQIVQAILASDRPVIVWVAPSGAHAASAGTLITLSAHIAAMAPATRIGAAHPVTGSGKDPEADGGKHMGRKVENDLAAYAESLAKERGRNVEWAIDAVRASVSITADRALEIGVIDLVASDRAELFEKLDQKVVIVKKQKVRLSTKGAVVKEFEPSLRDRVLSLLATPGIAALLGLLGMIGILIEIYHPGVIAPGVMGVLCIICSLVAFGQLPINVGALVLVVGGIGLLVAEIYTSTYGALGILGGVALAFGLLLVFDPSKPEFALDASFRLTLLDVLPLVAALGVVVAYLAIAVARTRNRPSMTGREGLIGARGFVLAPMEATSEIMVFVNGEYWKARADEALLENTEIEVLGVDGLVLKVKARSNPTSASRVAS